MLSATVLYTCIHLVSSFTYSSLVSIPLHLGSVVSLNETMLHGYMYNLKAGVIGTHNLDQ